MNLSVLKNISEYTPEEMVKFEVALLKSPQAQTPVYHTFGPNLYIRELHVPAGTFATGREQKNAQMNVVLKGSCTFYTPEGVKQTISAPHMMVAPAGKKVGIFLEDSIWLNIYSTDKKDVLSIEQDIFTDSVALYEQEEALGELYSEVIELEREDYNEACRYLGFTPEQVQEMAEYEGDLIPFPDGTYSVMVRPSMLHGLGLFATAPIKAGDIIAKGRIDGKRTPAGRYTNHSALPNARMVMSDDGDVDLVACEDIGGSTGGLMGDEVTVNYIDAFLSTRIEE